jgi:hypothetical protein
MPALVQLEVLQAFRHRLLLFPVEEPQIYVGGLDTQVGGEELLDGHCW